MSIFNVFQTPSVAKIIEHRMREAQLASIEHRRLAEQHGALAEAAEKELERLSSANK